MRVATRGQGGDFLRFAALSGGGWLIDCLLLLWLTAWADVPPMAANMASAGTAATIVFLVSRRRIHRGTGGAVPQRLALYLGYTALLILAASALLEALARVLADWPAPVLLAKAAVTPPTLTLNFLVSRGIARHG